MACKFVSAAPVVSNEEDVVRIRFNSGGVIQEFGLTPHAAIALQQQLRGKHLRQAAQRQLANEVLNLQDSFCRP